ncbi:HNH endonuclease [bacterium]|nr:HNH endonuclease [bacterium]
MKNKRRKLSPDEKAHVYNKFNGHCAYCGCGTNLSDVTIDHVKPLNKNGTDETDNMFPCCYVCNHIKHNFTVSKFRSRIVEICHSINIDDTNIISNNSVKPERLSEIEIAKKYGSEVAVSGTVVFYYEKVVTKKL